MLKTLLPVASVAFNTVATLPAIIQSISNTIQYITKKKSIPHHNNNIGSPQTTDTPIDHNNASTNDHNKPQPDWLQYHQQHYIPHSPLQRALLFIGSSTLAALDTYRGDMVATVAETIQPDTQLTYLYNLMLQSNDGQLLLSNKPRITHNQSIWSMNELSKLPHNTFGYQYYQFMSVHGYSADERTPVRFISNPDYAYIIQRYREIHDLWHIILGFSVSVEHEIAQKYFEYIHTGLLIGCLSSSKLAQLNLTSIQRHELNTLYIPYLNKLHNNIMNQQINLLCIYYEHYLDHDMDELRKQWGVTTIDQMRRIERM